jgi:hypothetical protein
VSSNFLTLPNTANTLSVFYRPGEDARLVNSSSPSIFTFGDFRIYTDNASEPLSSETLNLSFGSFSTLESLDGVNLKPPTSYSVSPNELNLNPSDSYSYAYFGSFYTEVANAINTITSSFPYAALAYDGGTGTTIYDYTPSYNNITGQRSATFKIPYSVLKNQGGIIINSGSSIGSISIASDYSQFAIQMSSTTSSAQTQVLEIKGFSFSSNTTPYLEFSTNDFLEGVTGSTSSLPIYIRPTKQRLANFKFQLSELEYNMLYGFTLKTLDVENDRDEIDNKFLWPTTIDGFNPDTYGSSFESFKKSMLKSAADTDDAKTNILVKTVIPENYLELDSEQQIYASLVQTYGHEFDEIKKYIDGIAFAHTVTYNKIENVPDKFLKKLSSLLGWKLSDSFSELDLFQYLAGNADGENNSFSYYNLEIWRRILININWLYKRKGTRDAIQFVFKLLGAPECLLKFDEFVYKINKSVYQDQTASNNFNFSTTPNQTAPNVFAVDQDKINENGYINYSVSNYIFQEGGSKRGNGDVYINQWKPEFDPLIEVDNVKIVVGDSNVFGSEDTINTKEVNISLDPAQAIECDVFQFYQLSGTCWLWGSMAPPFSSLTVPFEYSVDCDTIQPDYITGMTFSQYIEHIYTNSINPRDRKVLGHNNTSSFYPTLRNAYLNYYLWSNPQSHRLTFHKLQPFLDLIEVNFNTYFEQVIPATTIFDSQGTTIRNTVFNRQKFVYKPGLNDGSEFRTKLEAYEPNIAVINLTTKVNDQVNLNIKNLDIDMIVVETINGNVSHPSIQMIINPNSLVSGLAGYSVGAGSNTSTTLSTAQQNPPTLINPPSGFFAFP